MWIRRYSVSYALKYTLKLIIFSSILLLSFPADAFETFIIKDIRLDGLRRISPGTVFNYLPVKVGDRLDQNKASSHCCLI